MDLAMRSVVAGSMERRASVDTAVVTAIVNKNPRNLNNNLYAIKEKKEVTQVEKLDRSFNFNKVNLVANLAHVGTGIN